MIYDLVAWERRFRPKLSSLYIERATLPPAVRRAQAFECISHATAGDLVDRFPRSAGRVHVVPLAAHERFVPSGPRGEIEGRPFVLGVGTLEPRKNLPRLIEAFAGLSDEVRGDRLLVLAGTSGWQSDETFSSLGRHRHLVRPLGHVSDDRLALLYRSADLFAYPSLFEGFGLPVLEAMQSGTPVVTSRRSSLPEVAGDAALYVDPEDVASIRAALTRGLTDTRERERLRQSGLERAGAFSWARTGAETISVLEFVRAGAPSS